MRLLSAISSALIALITDDHGCHPPGRHARGGLAAGYSELISRRTLPSVIAALTTGASGPLGEGLHRRKCPCQAAACRGLCPHTAGHNDHFHEHLAGGWERSSARLIAHHQRP